MTRVPRVEIEHSGDAQLRCAVASLDRIGEHHRVLANNPRALAAFIVMSRYVRAESSLDGGLRELAVVTTGATLGSDYICATHLPLARREGISEVQIEAARDARAYDAAFGPQAAAVVAWAAEVGRDRTVSQRSFERAADLFGAETLIDLALIVGWYHLCATAFEPLGVGR